MKIFARSKWAMLFGLVVLMGGLSSCASTVVKTKDVQELAQERWDTLFSGDLHAAYEYLSPGYRSSVSSIQYQKSVLTQRVQWTGAEVIGGVCLESSCKIQISLDFSLIAVLPGVPRYDGNQTVDENWIKTDGKWWFVPAK
jgi:hypothetical protein